MPLRRYPIISLSLSSLVQKGLQYACLLASEFFLEERLRNFAASQTDDALSFQSDEFSVGRSFSDGLQFGHRNSAVQHQHGLPMPDVIEMTAELISI